MQGNIERRFDRLNIQIRHVNVIKKVFIKCLSCLLVRMRSMFQVIKKHRSLRRFMILGRNFVVRHEKVLVD